MKWIGKNADRGEEGKQRQDGGFWSSVRFFASVLLLAWAFRSFLIAPFSIPSGSMLPAMYIGDYVAVAKWPYGYSTVSFPLGIPSFEGRFFRDLPERGDVVVFRSYQGDDVVKRVIGLPGDRVAVIGGMLVLNGQPIRRSLVGLTPVELSPNSPCRVAPGATPRLGANRASCLYPTYRETLPGGRSYLVIDQIELGSADNFAPVTVPEDHVFLLGDNRDDSLDSRFGQEIGGLGFVPVPKLIGRAQFIFWSTDGSASYWKPWTWFTALRGSRIGQGFDATDAQ